MIARMWHGWTTRENADAYHELLRTEVFPAIASKAVEGYHGIRLLRRETGGEVEFITIMKFASMDAVREFAGDDYETAYVTSKARGLLSRFDERSKHYEIAEEIAYAKKASSLL